MLIIFLGQVHIRFVGVSFHKSHHSVVEIRPLEVEFVRADRDEFLRRCRDLVSKGFNFDHVDTVDVRAFERSIVLFDIAVVPIVKPAVDIYPGVCLDGV